ncbi:MAG: phosphate acyltransferase PlsX [Elusimicrobia bacterium]|nr:phosphate acyltransferase PlsX [Elusimicrobiota bacterium]
MKIALDAAAGDVGLAPNIDGAIMAANAWGVDVILVGPASDVETALRARGIAPSDTRFEIVDAREIVGMGEDPAAACRNKPHASILVAAELAASGKASAVVSTGNSGATMVAALWHLKRLPDVLRPAIAVPIPTVKGTSVLIDGGANTECKPWHLLQFGMMGSVYCRHLLGIPEPSVGILSIGEEDSKGNDLVREAIPLLKSSGLRYYGPVEGRDLTAGTVDVVVCDGFVGNIAIKVIEGTAASVMSLLKSSITGTVAKLGAALLRGSFAALKRKMNYDEYGGAPLLGVNGTVVICHGRSNAKAVSNAIRVAKTLVESGASSQIARSLDEMKRSMETEQARG